MMEIDEKLVNEARAGDVDAMLKVADYIVFSDRTQPIEPELLEQAQEYYRKAIAANDWRAMLNVGVMYYEGRGVEQDYAKALHWYQKAADRGSVTAMSNLGYCYYYGRSVPVDYEKAYELYARAALICTCLAGMCKRCTTSHFCCTVSATNASTRTPTSCPTSACA